MDWRFFPISSWWHLYSCGHGALSNPLLLYLLTFSLAAHIGKAQWSYFSRRPGKKEGFLVASEGRKGPVGNGGMWTASFSLWSPAVGFPDACCTVSNWYYFVRRMRLFNTIVILLIHFWRAHVFIWFKNQNNMHWEWELDPEKFCSPPPASPSTTTPLGNRFY